MTFKKISETSLTDIQSQAVQYEHVETGSKVIYIQNSDPNRAFTIGFKTPVSSDNGVAHIVEHSVLNGSKNYPSKEPFVELIKGSLNTFVNAMTYADRTVYPVASTNEADFENLVSVYLDAVFFPLFYDNPQILAQEGWHYHLESPEDELIYKGVVYNEMKGATASADRQVYDVLTRNMFADSHYQWESGGLPQAIPNLTQKDFVAFHQRYYHPSNAYTIIYGDVDINHYLDLMESYFQQFDKQDNRVSLKASPKITTTETIIDSYNVTEGEAIDNKDILALSWYVGGANEVVDNFGMAVLDEILLGNDQAPLRKAILDANIGGDLEGGVDDIGYPRAFDLVVKYSQQDKLPQLLKVVEDTLQSLVDKGIDASLVEAAMNKIIFQLKEMVISESNPRGIIYALEIIKQWVYDEEPFTGLEFSKYLGKIEQFAEHGYFESLIQEKLLNNAQRIQAVLLPQAGKNDAIEADRLAKLQEFKESLSPEELQSLVDHTQALIQRQDSPDKPEDLAKIPTLTREDLSADTPEYPLEVTPFVDGTNFFHAPQFTAGIDYVALYIDISDIAMEDFAWLKLLSNLLGVLDTQSMTAAQLQTQKDIHTGGIVSLLRIFEGQDGQVKPYFVVSGKALEENLNHLSHLMHEIFTRTIWNQPQDILNRVHQSIANFEQKIAYSSHTIASDRALSQYSILANLMEHVSGIDYYHFLKDIKNQLEEGQSDAIISKLETMMNTLLNRQRMSLLYVGDKERGGIIREAFVSTFETVPHQPLSPKITYHTRPISHEAYVTSQDVNYVAFANKHNQSLTGALEVLATLLRFDYLWNNIRVKGGAYGAMYQYRRTGDVAFVSYRDPNIVQTLATYQGVPSYVTAMEISAEALDKNVIGTMSRYTRPLSALDRGMKAFTMYMSGLTFDDERAIKQGIMDTQLADIQALAPIFQQVMSQGSYVVIGNKAHITKEADRFDAIYDLF